MFLRVPDAGGDQRGDGGADGPLTRLVLQRQLIYGWMIRDVMPGVPVATLYQWRNRGYPTVPRDDRRGHRSPQLRRPQRPGHIQGVRRGLAGSAGSPPDNPSTRRDEPPPPRLPPISVPAGSPASVPARSRPGSQQWRGHASPVVIMTIPARFPTGRRWTGHTPLVVDEQADPATVAPFRAEGTVQLAPVTSAPARPAAAQAGQPGAVAG
jgi:hypothetical protein